MKKFGLTGNQLKLIALVSMTIDHVGMILLPQYPILRYIGRLAFPIYAYMIAEGCRYTRSMPRYLGGMAALATLYQLVYGFVLHSLFQGVLVTFSLSIAMVMLLQYALEKKKAALWAVSVGATLLILGITEVLPSVWQGSGFDVDYGFLGVMLPVGIFLARSKTEKLCFAAAVLFLMGLDLGWMQRLSLLAIPLLALYNDQRGKWKMKYLFYIYYPAHLVVIYLFSMLKW